MLRRALITQSQLRNYSGSEVVTLELAEHLCALGWDVTVLTHFADDPIKSEFDNLPLRLLLTTSEEAKRLNIENFDLIWIHHYTLMPGMAQGLKTRNNNIVVVFNHMSYIDSFETPYLFSTEESLANIVLFNSEETKSETLKHLEVRDVSCKVGLFENPAPDVFYAFKKKPRNLTKLRRLAIISNHPPDEVVEAARLLRESKLVEVDFIGRVSDGQVIRVTPQLLSKYDSVISIGKTVQYCIAMNIPAYCYDRFGGPGYLNATNFSKAREKNFSGRGFSVKSVDMIVSDILKTQYLNTCNDFSEVHKKYADCYRLSANFDLILDISKSSKLSTSIDNEEVEQLDKLATSLSRLFPSHAYRLHKVPQIEERNRCLIRDLREKDAKIKEVSTQKRVVDARLKDIQDRLKAIESKVAYKLYIRIKGFINRLN